MSPVYFVDTHIKYTYSNCTSRATRLADAPLCGVRRRRTTLSQRSGLNRKNMPFLVMLLPVLALAIFVVARLAVLVVACAAIVTLVGTVYALVWLGKRIAREARS